MSLKYVGFLLMIIDHVTMLYFPDFIYGRIIGRFCAPIFFYELALGYSRTTDLKKYLERMIMWAGIAQVIIWSLIDFEIMPRLNILFIFSWCLVSLYVFDFQKNKFNKIVVFFVALYTAWFFQFDYGWFAVASVFLFRFYENSLEWKMLWITTALLTVFDSTIGILEIFTVFAPYVIFQLQSIKIKLPRLNWYFLYAVHWMPLSLPLFFM